MEKSFTFQSSKEKSIIWEVKYEVNGNYRDYVLLKQISQNDVRKRIPLIMFNPGSFIDEYSFSKDKTFQIIINIFSNSGYEIEVLNLYNIANVDRKELRKMDEAERDKNNQIFDRLKEYPIGSLVIIQWGKLEKYVEPKATLVSKYIKHRNLKEIGLKKEDKFYYHPLRILWENKIGKFKQVILPNL